MRGLLWELGGAPRTFPEAVVEMNSRAAVAKPRAVVVGDAAKVELAQIVITTKLGRPPETFVRGFLDVVWNGVDRNFRLLGAGELVPDILQICPYVFVRDSRAKKGFRVFENPIS